MTGAPPPAARNVAEYLLGGKPADRPALHLAHADHTYGELQDAVRAVACYLRRQGAVKGERAILVAENSLFWVAAYLGTLEAGMVSVPLPAGTPPEDLHAIVGITEARVAFVQAAILHRNPGLFRGMHLITDRETAPIPIAVSQTNWGEVLASGAGADTPDSPGDADGLAALMFTSGSTGAPRGVMVSHRNIIANTESIIAYLGLTERDRIMDVLPFHYCFGASLLHTHLRAGASIVVDQRFLYPEAVLQRMIETRCTGFAGVPSHFQILLRNSSLARTALPHLRYVQQAGGCLAPGFVRQLRAALPGTRIFIMYGQTEATARLSYLPPELLDRKPGSIGKGIPGVRLLVLDESGTSVLPGETGEIVAAGENITRGYWRAPAETAATFRNGQLYTGDLATVDADGFIYIIGRAKDMLKCGGERVSCRRVEEELLAVAGVEDAAVTGIPDDVLGEAVQAFLVMRRPACGAACDWRRCRAFREQVRTACRQRLPAQLIPRQIVLTPELPRSSAGKLLKSRLNAPGPLTGADIMTFDEVDKSAAGCAAGL
ncbi:MAG TPA: AMP-binding protein [Bryobacteraceae bacterium]|nr:AMP-binding protein [Bryobacteraceae bacterium]